MKIFALISLLVGFSCATSLAQRESVELSTGWKFIKQEVTPDAAFDTWESVSLPHTWNALDGQNGKTNDPAIPDGYYRGPGWYAKKLDVPLAWKGKRVFIHSVITGGQPLNDTLSGFEALAETTREKNIVVWLNEYFGPVLQDGAGFADMPVCRKHGNKLHGSVAIARRTADTFGRDMEEMISRKLTSTKP